MDNGVLKHNYQIDNLRAIAILLVVFGHSIILYSSSWNIYTSDFSVPALDYIKSAINLIQMPLFFSLSGFLFVFSVEKRKMLTTLKNKAVRLLVPYLFIAFLWLLPIRLLLSYPGYQGMPIWLIIVKCILYGSDNGHLWYLLALFWCFVLGTILHKALSRIKNRLFVIFLISIFMYVVAHITNVIYFNQLFLNYIWFVLGEIIAMYYPRFQNLRFPIKCILLVLSCISLVYCVLGNETGIVKMGIDFLTSMSLVILLFLIVTPRENRILSFFSSSSFGLYLFHSPLVYITYTFIPNAYPWIVVLLNFFAFGGVALVMTILIKKTKIKFIIGE